MSTTRLIVPYSFSRLHMKPSTSSQTFIFFNPICHSAAISKVKHKNKSCFPANRRLQYLSNGWRGQTDVAAKRYLTVYSGVPPGLPSDSWKHWIVGMLITAILPFFSHKWGPLFKLTKEIENAVETADHITEAIESIAEKVEEVADEVADELPEGGRLKKAFVFVEKIAKETAKDAHLVEQFIDKVEEVEEKVESFIQPVIDEANEIAKEANDIKSSL